jgi:GNAT superfamily N-acetyltransferase
MTEIRPVRDSEADAFLCLLCEVFDLDHTRAQSIFFAEPLFDLRRKWALFRNGEMLSILTTVPLEFGWGKAIGIAGVATAKNWQRQGYAGQLLLRVLRESADVGEGKVLLFARDTRLYRRLGFEVLDDVVRGTIDAEAEQEVPLSLEFERVRDLYDSWAAGDQNRLRRDEVRWNYWRWNLRICTPFERGYMCFEGGVVREVVLPGPPSRWELPPETEWLGLSTMADRLRVPLKSSTVDLHLMGFHVPALPQFFMTDQF